MSENQTTPPAAAAPAKGSSALLPIINMVVLVGVLAVVVMMFLAQKKNAAATAAAPAVSADGKPAEGKAEGGEAHDGAAPATKAAPGAGPTVRFPDFVIHLRNPEADRYARMSFEIEVASDKDKDVLTAHQAQIRDAFIAYLSDRTVEELRGSAGLGLVKAALTKLASELAPDGHVSSIYITDFVVQ